MLHNKSLTKALVAIMLLGPMCVSAQSNIDKILQKTSINLSVGFANYGGDLQQRRFTLNQAGLATGFGISYNLTDRLKLRGEYTFAKIGADDKLNTKAALQARNLNFKANLFETALTLQYDLMEAGQGRLTPYVFAGVAYFKASPYTYDVSGNKVFLVGQNTEGQGSYSTKHISIPFGAGIRMQFTDIFGVSFEAGFRKTFTDYIDDVSGNYPDPNTLSALAAQLSFRGNEINKDATFPTGGQRGNPAQKDYYYFGMLKLHANLGFLSKTGIACPKRVL